MSNEIDFPEEWFSTDVPEGVWKRFRHPSCSSGKSKALAIARTGSGWVWHCHRCDQHGFKPAANLSPKDMMKWLKSKGEKAQEYTKEVQLPEDFTFTIPTKGLAWLYGNGVSKEQMKQYHFGYSQYYDRVILPVYDKDKLIYWEGRYLGVPDKYHPKYMKVSDSNRMNIYFVVDGHSTETVVLVEDILSAVKVGDLFDCYAMLYAFIPDNLVFELAKKYGSIILWLDADKEHQMISRTMRYRSFGINVEFRKTKKDPKDYTLSEIRNLLTNGGKE